VNSGATAARVYEVLKRRIMDHEFRPGERLDPSALAETLASSVTPVREALHVLTGEGLVETRTSDGFHLPQIDEPALKDLYAWNGEVIQRAIRAWPTARASIASWRESRVLVSFADRARDLFARIGEQSINAEHGRAIASLNARLHAARTIEPHVIDDVEAGLEAIGNALSNDDDVALRRLMTPYHRQRQRAAADIVRALYRIG
jgi:DNA-binding transcriptional MocR family regulator